MSAGVAEKSVGVFVELVNVKDLVFGDELYNVLLVLDPG